MARPKKKVSLAREIKVKKVKKIKAVKSVKAEKVVKPVKVVEAVEKDLNSVVPEKKGAAEQKLLKETQNSVSNIGHEITNIAGYIGARRFMAFWMMVSAFVATYFGVMNAVAVYRYTDVFSLDLFLIDQFFVWISLFMKFFIPMFLFVIACVFLFVYGNYTEKRRPRVSKELKQNVVISLGLGFVAGILYYLDAGHIIGRSLSEYCLSDQVCWFSWDMVWFAVRRFAIVSFILTLTITSFRAIYSELSFMFAKK